jgi:hypothetical protein
MQQIVKKIKFPYNFVRVPLHHSNLWNKWSIFIKLYENNVFYCQHQANYTSAIVKELKFTNLD